jgi:hypothetical protein
VSAHATTATIPSVQDGKRGHRIRLISSYLLAVALIVGLAVYGFNYYTLSSAERPFSSKHAILKPSGTIGLKLGFLGVAMFLIIFLYPLRKRWVWLSRQGSSRHWLDFHVLLGLSAPFVIALHSSFKFQGFAGIAYWIMVAVSLSGVVGRYLYGQIPRRLNSAEITLRELQEMQATHAAQLSQQKLLQESGLRSLLRLPSRERVEALSIPVALVYMMALDIARVLRVATLRRSTLSFRGRLLTLGGMLPTGNRRVEKIIASAREEAALAKRILFLSRSQQVFHLWHVVHKPFSYSFAVLVVIHIAVVIMMGYF